MIIDDVAERLRQHIIWAVNAVQDLDADTFLLNSEDEIVSSIIKQYSLEAPQFDIEKAVHEKPRDTKDSKGYRLIEMRVLIPVTGTDGLLPQNIRDDYIYGKPVHEQGTLYINYSEHASNVEQIVEKAQKDIQRVRTSWNPKIRDIVEAYYRSLAEHIRKEVTQRKADLQRTSVALTRLSIPLRRASEEVTSAIIPMKRSRSALETLKPKFRPNKAKGG